MDLLTRFERDLLAQFRALATEFEKSQTASVELSDALASWSKSIVQQQKQIDARLTEIEATQKRLTGALDAQNTSTSNLVEQVNRLLKAQGH